MMDNFHLLSFTNHFGFVCFFCLTSFQLEKLCIWGLKKNSFKMFTSCSYILKKSILCGYFVADVEIFLNLLSVFHLFTICFIFQDRLENLMEDQLKLIKTKKFPSIFDQLGKSK